MHEVGLNALKAGPQVVAGLLLGAHKATKGADAVGLKVALDRVHVGQVDLIHACLMLPQRVLAFGVGLVAAPDGLGEHLREHASRPAGTNGLSGVVPALVAHVVDDGVGAFGSVALGVEPPDLAPARDLGRPDLLALLEVDVVKEEVLVVVVGDLLDHAVVHQEAVHTGPVEDAVVLDHAAR